MISKFLRTAYRYNPRLLMTKRLPIKIINTRHMTLIPPTQYDLPYPRRLKLGYILRCNWEVIPLFFCTCFGLTLMVVAILWAFKNKVDTVYTSRSRHNISRTMDLRHPTCHKMIIINQRYEPWPEMQDVLDKMKMAEKRAKMRAQSCANP